MIEPQDIKDHFCFYCDNRLDNAETVFSISCFYDKYGSLEFFTTKNDQLTIIEFHEKCFKIVAGSDYMFSSNFFLKSTGKTL